MAKKYVTISRKPGQTATISYGGGGSSSGGSSGSGSSSGSSGGGSSSGGGGASPGTHAPRVNVDPNKPSPGSRPAPKNSPGATNKYTPAQLAEAARAKPGTVMSFASRPTTSTGSVVTDRDEAPVRTSSSTSQLTRQEIAAASKPYTPLTQQQKSFYQEAAISSQGNAPMGGVLGGRFQAGQYELARAKAISRGEPNLPVQKLEQERVYQAQQKYDLYSKKVQEAQNLPIGSRERIQKESEIRAIIPSLARESRTPEFNKPEYLPQEKTGYSKNIQDWNVAFQSKTKPMYESYSKWEAKQPNDIYKMRRQAAMERITYEPVSVGLTATTGAGIAGITALAAPVVGGVIGLSGGSAATVSTGIATTSKVVTYGGLGLTGLYAGGTTTQYFMLPKGKERETFAGREAVNVAAFTSGVVAGTKGISVAQSKTFQALPKSVSGTATETKLATGLRTTKAEGIVKVGTKEYPFKMAETKTPVKGSNIVDSTTKIEITQKGVGKKGTDNILSREIKAVSDTLPTKRGLAGKSGVQSRTYTRELTTTEKGNVLNSFTTTKSFPKTIISKSSKEVGVSRVTKIGNVKESTFENSAVSGVKTFDFKTTTRGTKENTLITTTKNMLKSKFRKTAEVGTGTRGSNDLIGNDFMGRGTETPSGLKSETPTAVEPMRLSSGKYKSEFSTGKGGRSITEPTGFENVLKSSSLLAPKTVKSSIFLGGFNTKTGYLSSPFTRSSSLFVARDQSISKGLFTPSNAYISEPKSIITPDVVPATGTKTEPSSRPRPYSDYGYTGFDFPIIDSPKIPPVGGFYFGDIGGGGGFGSKRGAKGKRQGKQYAPSLYSKLFGVSGRESAGATRTGLSLRPLVMSSRKKF